jgi:RimJ/RimL family protein N-acetyltransferase
VQAGRHVLHAPALRLETPTVGDFRIMLAAASDPQAQRVLGWTGREVVPERDREYLLALPQGRGRVLSGMPGPQCWLAAIDVADGRLAGAISVDRDTSEVGGWLAPRFRGRGLGTALFAGAAEFAHHHLGIPSVTAGTEAGNVACIAALASAGFFPTAGPDTHTLPNGRAAPSRWFRHESAQPAMCGG